MPSWFQVEAVATRYSRSPSGWGLEEQHQPQGSHRSGCPDSQISRLPALDAWPLVPAFLEPCEGGPSDSDVPGMDEASQSGIFPIAHFEAASPPIHVLYTPTPTSLPTYLSCLLTWLSGLGTHK